MKWTAHRICKPSKRAVVVTASAVVALFRACAFLGISHPNDLRAYVEMSAECHPVWREFAFRRLGAGDSAADLIRRFPPTRREDFGACSVYHYHQGPAEAGIAFTGMTVVARDGRLTQSIAWSCTWQHSYFEAPDPDFDKRYGLFRQEQIEAFRRRQKAELK